MKLYYSVGACSLAVRIVINELKLVCDYEAVDLSIKKTETGEDFSKINIKGSVPTLMLDNGQVLTENAVIQRYLTDKQKNSHLLPAKEDFKHYHVLEWLNFMSTDVHKGFSPLFNKDVPQELKESLFIPALRKKFDFVNEQLAENDYLTGNEFTLPDGYLFVLLSWLKYFNMNIADWAHLARFVALVKERPAVQKSLEEENIKL